MPVATIASYGVLPSGHGNFLPWFAGFAVEQGDIAAKNCPDLCDLKKK